LGIRRGEPSLASEGSKPASEALGETLLRRPPARASTGSSSLCDVALDP
jgi:hypothetical protein